ncbi:MAG: tetratricopeptide repeat protein [Bacteroidota bacterium]
MIVLLIFPFLLLNAQTDTERAAAAFRQQEAQQYTEAISTYEGLLTAGYGSADIHFNLAMAYYDQQQLGKAILHLEKAYRIKPYDEAVSKNLELLRNEQEDGILPLPTFFLKDWWNTLGARLSPDVWGGLSLLLLFIGCFLLGTRVWYKQKADSPAWYTNRKKQWPLLGASALVLAILFVLLANTRKTALNRMDEGIITTPTAGLYVAPDESTEVTLEIHEGLHARIVDEFEGWLKITLSDGQEGWTKSGVVERI